MRLYKEHKFYNRRREIFQNSEQSLVSCRDTQLATILKNCERQEKFIPAIIHKAFY